MESIPGDKNPLAPHSVVGRWEGLWENEIDQVFLSFYFLFFPFKIRG